MYIEKVSIENIRCIHKLELDFKDIDKAGWHVILGDNGVGKSSLLRGIVATLLGDRLYTHLKIVPEKWLKNNTLKGIITSKVFYPPVLEPKADYNDLNKVEQTLSFIKNDNNTNMIFSSSKVNITFKPNEVGFSAAYGPFRSFSGKHHEETEHYYAKLFAHQSCFDEDFALTNSLEWLRTLKFRQLDKTFSTSSKKDKTLDWVIQFINNANLLPNNTKIKEVNSSGVFFKDALGNIISVLEMSDGYRSVLSLTLDLVYRLVYFYGADVTFKTVKNKGVSIDVPGVVLIDEVDAHLHPTWQTKIGTWFTTHFPNIQFIVTTHSPLVCRSAIKGSIWELEHSEDGVIGHQITGTDYNRLVYGNVLDALGTTVFGKNIGRSESSNKMLKELAILNMRQQQGDLSEEDQTQLNKLRQIFMTDVADNFLND
ncbi:MAG: AAA family ATPase [Aureispira sp.]|nr:AAA family ATPase [Aureispira sp.]